MKYSYQNLFNLNPTAKTFLDLGCGQGFVSLYACARGLQVDAVDIEKVTPLAIQDLKTVNYISADLNSWQPAHKYDIIVAHHSLQFLSKEYALNEFIPKLCASLNQGGLLEIFSFTSEEELDVPTKYALEEIPLTCVQNEQAQCHRCRIKPGEHGQYAEELRKDVVCAPFRGRLIIYLR